MTTGNRGGRVSSVVGEGGGDRSSPALRGEGLKGEEGNTDVLVMVVQLSLLGQTAGVEIRGRGRLS